MTHRLKAKEVPKQNPTQRNINWARKIKQKNQMAKAKNQNTETLSEKVNRNSENKKAEMPTQKQRAEKDAPSIRIF